MRLRLAALLLVLMLLGADSAYAQSAFNDPGSTVGPEGLKADLVAVEPKVDAGIIAPGTNNSMIVQFRNESGTEIQFKDVKLFPSSNVTGQIVSDQCSSEPLQAGAQCAVVLEARGLQSGAFRVEVLARHTGRSRLVTASISGTVEEGDTDKVKPSDIEITPAILDFGKLDASRPIIRSATLRNITSSEITINDLFIDAPEGSGFSLKTDCKSLMAGASCIASVVWSPVTKGPTSGALVVQHTGASGVVTANMTGEFSPIETVAAKAFPEAVPGKGLLVASEEEIDFGAEIESQSSITVSLVNIGDAPLTLDNIALAGSEQGLKLNQEGCHKDLTLEPTEACPLTVSWAPTKMGMVIDDVRVTHTGARGILVLPVRGTSKAAVSVDSKPIVTVIETVDGGKTTVVTPAQDSGPPVLDGYMVTSLSRKNAIISGPGGSRMVRDKQTIRLAGHEWVVNISPEGVGMTSGKNKVLLVFDRSLSKEGLASGAGVSTSVSTTFAEPPAPSAVPVDSTATTTAP